MTKQSAIDKIKCFPNWNLDDEWLLEEEMQELSDMAISALEKQIPKKPVMKNDDGIECDSGMSPYCPTCGIELTDRIPLITKIFIFIV